MMSITHFAPLKSHPMMLQRDSTASVRAAPLKLQRCSDTPRKSNSIMLQQLKSQASILQPLTSVPETNRGCLGSTSPSLLLLLLLLRLPLLSESFSGMADLNSIFLTSSLALHIVRDRFAPVHFTFCSTAPTNLLPLQSAPSKLLPVRSQPSKSESMTLHPLKFMPCNAVTRHTMLPPAAAAAALRGRCREFAAHAPAEQRP